MQCRFAGFGQWSTDNCTVREDNDTFVVCACDHFTNFAILPVSNNDNYYGYMHGTHFFQ